MQVASRAEFVPADISRKLTRLSWAFSIRAWRNNGSSSTIEYALVCDCVWVGIGIWTVELLGCSINRMFVKVAHPFEVNPWKYRAAFADVILNFINRISFLIGPTENVAAPDQDYRANILCIAKIDAICLPRRPATWLKKQPRGCGRPLEASASLTRHPPLSLLE